MQEQKAILMLVGETLQQKKNLVSLLTKAAKDVKKIDINREQHCGLRKGLAAVVLCCHAGLQSAWWC